MPSSLFGGRAEGGPAPKRPQMDIEAIPQELRDLPQWVVWRYRTRKGKATKIPYQSAQPTIQSDSTDPATWSTFAIAAAAAADPKNVLNGVGFVFSPEDPYVGIDLDNCVSDDGSVDSWASDILRELPTYAEFSPSKKGIKIFARGTVPNGGGRKVGGLGPDGVGALEIYDRGRYFTVTGKTVSEGAPVADLNGKLSDLHAKWFPPKPDRQSTAPNPTGFDDASILARAQTAKNGDKFSRLWSGDWAGYPSRSEAVLALCSLLAFWTGGDVDAIDRLFRQSGLVDEKWIDRESYRDTTISKACDRTDFYDPGAGITVGGVKGVISAPVVPPVEKPNQAEFVADIATAADLRAAQAGISWLWHGWIQRSVLTLLAAEPGKGKTRFCMDLSRRLALGLPWPDGTPNDWPIGTPTLWVPADNQHAELADMPIAFGFDPGLLYLNTTKGDLYGGTELANKDQLAALEWHIRCVGPGLVFIDTITNTSDHASHDTADAKKQYKPLQEIAKKTNSAIVCVTHLNAGGKTVGRRADEKVRTAIRLEHPDPEGQPARRKLHVTKSNSLPPKALGITMGENGNEYDEHPPVGPDEDRAGVVPPPGRLKDAVDFLNAQLRHGPKRVSALRELGEQMGFSSKTLYKAKDLVGAREYLEENRKWWSRDETDEDYEEA